MTMDNPRFESMYFPLTYGALPIYRFTVRNRQAEVRAVSSREDIYQRLQGSLSPKRAEEFGDVDISCASQIFGYVLFSAF